MGLFWFASIVRVVRFLAIGLVGLVLFWFLFWSLGAGAYYGQRLEKHRLELLLERK